MTMAEYRKALSESIPIPTTIQQEMLMNAVTKINEQLMRYGEASLYKGRHDGDRRVLCIMARNIKKMYQSKGYIVSLYEYSENNRDSFFTMTIKVGAL